MGIPGKSRDIRGHRKHFLREQCSTLWVRPRADSNVEVLRLSLSDSRRTTGLRRITLVAYFYFGFCERTILPFFMTKFILRSDSMSWSGSVGMAMMSAKRPEEMAPRSLEIRRSSAPLEVMALRVSAGVTPAARHTAR